MTTSKQWTIRYRYPGTVSGEPVGMVYVLDIGHLAPGAWSYSKMATEATQWPTQEAAEAELAKHRYWPEARVVEVDA